MGQYLRNWLFTITRITRSDDGTYETGESKTFDSLRIVFDLKNTMLGDPTTGYFQMYNIGQSTKDMLSSSTCLVKMEISYGNDKKRLLFQGEVTNSYQLRQGTDTVHQIWARDSGYVLEDFTLKPKSYKVDKTPYELITDIVATAPLPTTTISFLGSAATVLQEADPIDNYSNLGSLHEQLDNLTNPYKLTWTCAYGAITVLSEDDAVKELDGDSPPFTVSISTGLLTRPNVDYVGVSFTHLMNTRFSPGNLVRIEKITAQRSFGNEFYVPIDEERSELDSLYRVMEVQHKGDTRGVNWSSVVRVFTK